METKAWLFSDVDKALGFVQFAAMLPVAITIERRRNYEPVQVTLTGPLTESECALLQRHYGYALSDEQVTRAKARARIASGFSDAAATASPAVLEKMAAQGWRQQ